MALRDWVRHEGTVDSSPTPGSGFDHLTDEQFIMLVRNIQYDDIVKNRVQHFNSLYDVAMTNPGSYINVNNNYELQQSPPDPNVVNQHKK